MRIAIKSKCNIYNHFISNLSFNCQYILKILSYNKHKLFVEFDVSYSAVLLTLL